MSDPRKAAEVPLVERLDAVPGEATIVRFPDRYTTKAYPVGRLAHEAAAELRRQHAEITALRAALNLPVSEASESAKQESGEYRCYADIFDDEEPDGCVLDGGNPDDCMYARRYGGKAREVCGQWKLHKKEDET